MDALNAAGLPLGVGTGSGCGGSAGSIADGFAILSAAGRSALAAPLAETWLPAGCWRKVALRRLAAG